MRRQKTGLNPDHKRHSALGSRASRIAAAPYFLLALTAVCMSSAWSGELQRPDPGKKIRVFLLAGQSNMEGRANGLSLTPQDRERLHEAQKRVQLAYNFQPVQPLDVVEPSSEIKELYQVDRIFGPELFLGIALAEAWPGEKLLLIKLAAGGTSLYGSWNPAWSPEQAATMKEEDEPRLFTEFVSYIKQILSGYPSDQYEIGAMFWVQGESDAAVQQAAEAYGKNLGALVERIRAEMGLASMPFILLQVGDGKVVEGMQQVAKDLPNVSLVPQSLTPDSPDYLHKIPNGHYNHEGMKKIGTRFAETYLRNYAPKPSQ